ncbi:hypothetical protein Pelo_17461 [Pelomyxa schiedti]|nr:hypothetical protein Pelo_17461 [Pelomyxa schiedti]
MGCVAQFRVSAVLGSVVGREDDDDPVHWVCVAVSPRSRYDTINANCSHVVLSVHRDGDSPSVFLRNHEGRYGWWLVRDRGSHDRSSLNPKWFVVLQPHKQSLRIAALEQTKSAETGPFVDDVPITVDEGGMLNIFLNNTNQDEGVVCNIINKSGCCQDAAGSIAEITVVDIGQTWSSKRLKVDEGVGSVLPLPIQGGRGGDWKVSTSKLSDSLFCVVSFSKESRACPVEIWDVNHTATGSRPLRAIEVDSSVRDLIAEGGLFISRRERPDLARCDIVVTDPETGALILTASGHIDICPLLVSLCTVISF